MNDSTLATVAHALSARFGVAWAREIAFLAIETYERTVPSDRLVEILAARRVAVHDLERPATLERHESRACEVCNELIEPGEAYTPTGPAHARHRP
jgi:hypothetical protein